MDPTLAVIMSHGSDELLPHGKRLIELTPEEEFVYGHFFTSLIDGGAPRAIAIRQSWMDMQQAFPRLVGFHGPAPSVG